MKQGRLIGIGVGPGDPELLTIKAVRAIEQSQVIILPNSDLSKCYAYNIVKGVVPSIDEKKLVGADFPMTKDEKVLEEARRRVFYQVMEYVQEGLQVAFLTIGDPTVYSTYHYIHRKVASAGFEASIINGVPSFCAVAGRLGISLGDTEEQIHIIPGSYDIADTISLPGTKVYMKSGRQLEELVTLLEKHSDLEVYGVSNCGMEDELIMTGVQELKKASSYLTIVIVKGDR